MMNLQKPLLIGAALSVVAIVSFLALWFGLSELPAAPRLFTALCVPPAVLMLGVGGYALFIRSKAAAAEPSEPDSKA